MVLEEMMNNLIENKKRQSKPVRIEVVLLALCFALLFMLPGLMCLELLPDPWGYIAYAINAPCAFVLSILLANKLLTGKFINKGKQPDNDN